MNRQRQWYLFLVAINVAIITIGIILGGILMYCSELPGACGG